MKRRTFLLAGLGLTLSSSAALWLSDKKNPELQSFSSADIIFGTTVSIQVLHHDAHGAAQALQAAMNALHNIDSLMSLYRPDSQVSQLNQHGKLYDPHPELLHVLLIAQNLSLQTDGAFDVTVQPLWLAANQRQSIQSAKKHVNWKNLSISKDQVHFAHEGMSITLNGIAQGYGVDRALEVLQSYGIEHALLDTGEFGSLGRRDDGNPWTLAIQNPRDTNQYVQLLALDGRSMATSGDYAARFTDNYQQHHIFDPHTGKSPTELACVTVLAPSGLLADGLSTACMVLGAKKSLALISQMENVDIFCIDKLGHQSRSAGFPLHAAG
jgi:thiamine biosynthesis lipoprotein